MECGNATRAADTDPAARANHLRELIEQVLSESEALFTDLEERGVPFHWFGDTAEDLEYALVGLRALVAVRCDPAAYAYWVDRVHLRNTLDELRSESPEAWARFESFHRRFEARFPGIATKLAREAFLAATFPLRADNPSLERRALAAIAQLAGEAA